MLKIFSLSEVMLTLHLYLQLLQKEKKFFEMQVVQTAHLSQSI